MIRLVSQFVGVVQIQVSIGLCSRVLKCEAMQLDTLKLG